MGNMPVIRLFIASIFYIPVAVVLGIIGGIGEGVSWSWERFVEFWAIEVCSRIEGVYDLVSDVNRDNKNGNL